MPLTRYQSRNEYGLADPDLYQAADKDDPEALLEGVAMAGLVGILRQLGDLAEFAAEMFHDLHEEVMATASRSHGLMARVQQLEAEFPFVEKALLCQTDHTPFFFTKGVEWHSNLQLEQGVVTRGDLPRCVMDSYEECRAPPRLFLLDKFDISGAGACLKRYTDPSFVRHEKSSYDSSWDDIQREKKSQKAKRRASHWRNGGTPENALSSHAKLHELFLEEHLEARHSDPARVVKLKTRKLDGCSLISKSGESYMEKFVQNSVDNETGYQIITPNPELSTWHMDSAREVVTDKSEIRMVGAREKSHRGSRAEVSLPHEQENVAIINTNGGLIEKDIETVPESTHSVVPGTTITKDSHTCLDEKAGLLQHRSYSEDLTSEADNYVDAPATMEPETETDDDCRPKNRSGALKDANYHRYSDADEERIEDPTQFSFYHSMANTPVSENGRSSFGKGSTSFSFSDTASISIDEQSDGEKISGHLPTTSSFKSELVDSTSNATPEANRVSRVSNAQESVSSSNGDGQTSFISNYTCSSPRPNSRNAESGSLTDQSLVPAVVETSPELARPDLIKGGNDGNRVDPVASSRSGASFGDAKNFNFLSEISSISSTSGGSKYDTAIEKNCMNNYSSSLVKSGSKQLPVADNNFETSSAVASYKHLSKSGSDANSCDGSSLTGKLLPCSAGMETDVSPDLPSKVCCPSTVDEIHLKDTLDDDETGCVTGTNIVADVNSGNSVADVGSESSVADVDSENLVVDVGSQSVDSESLVAEISNENLCAFGTTPDVSLSESHEDKLENGMSMPAEVDRKLASDFNSGEEKLMGDASPTCSRCDDRISDIPAGFHSSHMHDEGFHDLPAVGFAATDAVPKAELVVSDDQDDTLSGDVDDADSHASTSMKGSLPWISTSSYQLSSKAGEICHDTVVESDGTPAVENNPELEKNMQESPLDVPLEDLGTALDNNDLESCESLNPMTSLDQSDRDTDPKSPSKSILVDNCVDSSAVNNLNLVESVTIEQSVKVQTPCASQTFADEELIHPSVSGGLEFVPQSAGIELNSPKEESNLHPTFPSFGLIPETTSPNQEDMPPLPPLPPMQWRIGKAPHSYFPTFMGDSVETSSSASSVAQPISSSNNVPVASKPSEVSVSLGSDKSEQLPGDDVNNVSEEPLQSSIQFPTFGTDLNYQYDSSGSQRIQAAYLSSELSTVPNHTEDSDSEEKNLLADHAAQNHELVYAQELSLQLPQDPSAKLPTMPNQGHSEDLGSEENNLLADNVARNHLLVCSGESSLQLPQDQSSGRYKDFEDNEDVNVSQNSEGRDSCPETEPLVPTQSEDDCHSVPDASNVETAETSTSSAQKISPDSLGDALWPVRSFSVAPTLDINKLEEVPMIKLPRPRSPLVDAVAAHDRRTMKKVSERIQPPIKSKQDDNNSLLAQIRNKSVSLKPAAATRPSIQTAPKTNLRVAAILEKANTIRQAMAGSDEDDDSDSWSDS